MNLKTLIPIRFVVIVLSFFCFNYLVGNVKDSYQTPERQNKILLEQKKYYEQILQLEDNDKAGKENLYRIIEVTDSIMESDIKKTYFNAETNVWILLGAGIIMMYVFNFLNTRIEKLKSQDCISKKEELL